MDAYSFNRFWMVWSPAGRAPTYMHESRESAEAEAERLAKISPGGTFFVLKAVGGRQSHVINRPIKITPAAPPLVEPDPEILF